MSSHFILQDSFRKDVDVDESDFDPNFLEWVNDDFNEAQDQKKDNNGIRAKACSSTRKINTLNEWAKERNAMSTSLCINERYQFVNLDLLKQDEKELCYWFSKFIVEVRQKKNPGMPYHYASFV